MQAGRELDALVAEKVMGWEVTIANGWEAYFETESGQFGPWVGLWQPSTNMSDAWEVVREMVRKGTYVEIAQGQELCTCCFNYDDYLTVERCESAPLAICLAALKAVGVERGE